MTREADKMTNRKIASEIATDCVNAIGATALSVMRKEVPEKFDLCGKIERALDAKDAALLEADKNGYERGRGEGNGGCCDCVRKYEAAQKDDEALLRECFDALGKREEFANYDYLMAKLKSRLALSGSVSDVKESQ